MSDAISTYSFLPWLRQGIANQIQAGSSNLRAEIPVTLELKGEGISPSPLTQSITKTVQVYGPGDVVGIEKRAIVKAEPRHWITNFEPNYLPYIEFYDEDFPWRYTPAAPGPNHRLTPWIMLVVLTEAEFKEGKNIKDRPLPYIEVETASAVFPRADQLWAWAHVHVNQDLGAAGEGMASTNTEAFLTKFQTLLEQNPDAAYSRIVSPRKLGESTAYHAFLVPVFESGRLAGLGLDPAKTPGVTASAWADYGGREQPTNFPYYHRWYFRTGTQGDFEYLVRLLQPKPVDKRVGRRDVDVQDPGSNLPGITDAKLNGVLQLGGALRVPLDSLKPEERAEVEKYENWDQPYPHPFQEGLAAFINLADDYIEQPPEVANPNVPLLPPAASAADGDEDEEDQDPLITPPLYGRWHGLTQRLLRDRNGDPITPNDNWVHELNLDPRHRMTAGFGTDVVKTHQEEYMDAAWEQVGEVLEANRRIRLAQLAKEISWIWYDRHLQPLRQVSQERALIFTAPLHKRVMDQGVTVYHQLNTSVVVPAVVSTPMRRVLRSRGRLVRSLPFGGRIQPGTLLERIDAGEVSAAPPKQTPLGVLTVDEAGDILGAETVPNPVRDWLRQFPWILPALQLVLLALVIWLVTANGSAFTFGLVLFASLFLLYDQLRRWAAGEGNGTPIGEAGQTPGSVDDLPRSPDFEVSEPGAGTQPTQGTTDSPEAVRFKEGLKDAYVLIEASREVGKTPPRRPISLPRLTTSTVEGINPEITIPRRLESIVLLPEYLKRLLGEAFQEVMAYPKIDLPMYKPLVDISAELFLPNINKVEQNSITLLETNQPFIEAYMVGLNHEFARELLWREYPTDQRGSYFRQFWDVSSFFNPGNLSNEALKEKLRDIPELHRWPKASKLGDHDHREEGGDKEEEVVLVIRGELLKKYPTAVIYAHKAQWPLKEDGSIDKTKERSPVDLVGAEATSPPRTKVKTPLYQAKVEPDIYFFGFDLTALEARGGTGEDPADKNKPGWFFVIKERPGEPRFGLDIEHAGKEDEWQIWNDLAWTDVQPGLAGTYLEINRSFSLTAPVAGADAESEARLEQHTEDRDIRWDVNTNAADLAYILYQVPVLVAVHASEMLSAPT